MSLKPNTSKFIPPTPRKRTRNIFCLESLWDDDIVRKLSVGPLLELTTQLWNVQNVHLTCNTRAEFEFNLKFLKRRRSFRILYLAFHGEPGFFKLSDDENVSLKELAKMLDGGFPGMVVHIGSCGTLRIREEDIRVFLKLSGVRLISGYSKDVDWAESAALDLLYFTRIQDYANLGSFIRSFESDYSGLIEKTGFQAFLK